MLWFRAAEWSDCPALLTAVGDVEAPARHGMVSLELQLQDVGVAGEVWRHLSAREAAQQLAIPHCQEVIGWLQVEVVEGQLDAASWLGDDQPHAVQIVAIAFWVIWWQDCPWGGREVGQTWDWRKQKIPGRLWSFDRRDVLQALEESILEVNNQYLVIPLNLPWYDMKWFQLFRQWFTR